MIKSIRMIGMSALAAGLSLLAAPVVAGAQDSVFVTSTGNVGVGTNTPVDKFHLFNSADVPTVLRIESTSTGANAVSNFRAQSNTAVAHFRAHGSGRTINHFGVVLGGWSELVQDIGNGLAIGTQNSTPIIFGTNNTNRVQIDGSTGDVGIGTSTPIARLDVQSNGSNPVIARFQNSNPNADVFMLLLMENLSTGLNGTSGLQLKSNTSFANIQAHGSGRTLSRFGQPLASWVEIAVTGASNGLIVGTTADKPVILGTNNADRLHIQPTGDIGIGTTTPASKLHVNDGDIRVSGGSFIDDGVTLNAPDYVFEPSYKLMPLEELREFVAQEKHLPNVPNAREVKEQGLNLSQFQMRLLEKIEELTLYTLAQQEQLAAQQATIAELAAKVEKLEEK